MEKIDHLIHTRWLITGEPSAKPLAHHSLALHDGKILDILPTAIAKEHYHAKQTASYLDHAVMPGLINSHTHLAMNVFRGLADDLELMDWLNNHIWPAEGTWVSDDLVYDASQLAIAEMIRGGITCFNDMYFFLGATARAAEEAGIRAHIGMTVIGVPTAWAKTPEDYFSKAIDFYQHYKNHALITPTLAPHSTYTVSLADLHRVKELAETFQLKINIHLHEAPSEIHQSLLEYQARPLQRLHQIGLVTPNLIAIHMTQLDEADFEIVQQMKPQIVHCPESNLKLVSGACQTAKLIAMGINVALGTDGAASNNDLDMIGEMRSAAFLGKITANDPKALPADQVLSMATLNGAKALGIEHLTGSLTIGKAADFIAINLEQIETLPLYQPISQIVYASSRHQVSDVWIAGKQVLKNRQLLTLDEEALLAKARVWGQKIRPSHPNTGTNNPFLNTTKQNS